MAAVRCIVPGKRDRYDGIAVEKSHVENGISEMLGLTPRGVFSEATQKNPDLFCLLMNWFRLQSGAEALAVTSIQINRNLRTKPHRDTANAGPSAMISFGVLRGKTVVLAG